MVGTDIYLYFFVFIFFIFLFEFINFLQNLLAFCLFYGNLSNCYKSRGAIYYKYFFRVDNEEEKRKE